MWACNKIIFLESSGEASGINTRSRVCSIRESNTASTCENWLAPTLQQLVDNIVQTLQMVKFYQRIVRETHLSEERVCVHLERRLLSSHPSLHSVSSRSVHKFTAAFPKDLHTVCRASERALMDIWEERSKRTCCSQFLKQTWRSCLEAGEKDTQNTHFMTLNDMRWH